jgi:hypothetical protein
LNTSLTSSAEASPVEADESSRRILDRWDAVIAIVVGVIIFGVYLRTIAPGLLVDDSGEFQTMTRLLGHTHPTGYEVYTLLGRVFSSIPIGDFATRVSAFSAFMGGVAAGLVYFISRLLRSPKAIAVIPALAFAVAPTVWSQGIIAEVYTPAAVFAGTIIASLLVWQRSGSPRWLVVAGVAGGMSLGVHFSIGLYLPAIACFVILVAIGRDEGAFSKAAWRNTWVPALSGAAVGVGAAVAIFVLVDIVNPAAQYFNAVVAPSYSDWDLKPGQIDGVFERLRFDWTARQFSGLMFVEDGLMAQRWDAFRASVSAEIATPLLVSAIVGFGYLLWRNWRAALFIVIALVTQLVFAFNYAIGDMIYVFYIPAYMLLALLSGAGLAAVVAGVKTIPGLPENSWKAASIVVAAVALIFGVYPVAAVNNKYVAEGSTPPYDFEAYPYNDYVASVMHPGLTAMVLKLPDGAIVFGDWDDLYPRFWVAHVEQGRTDLMFHETYPADDQEGMADSAVEYIVEMAAIRPVFVPERIPQLTEAGLSYSPLRVGPVKMLKVLP